MAEVKKMNIHFDILHPAHFNFLKNAIKRLSKERHRVSITGLNRGKLKAIVKNEFSDYNVKFIGRHRGNKYSIIFEANILRFLKMFFFLFGSNLDIGVSVGSFIFGFNCKLRGIPNLQFDDDPERKVNVFLEKLTSTNLIFPPIVEPMGKVKNMNALKEWAYLSPKYFIPNVDVLQKYKLTPKTYIFVREISTGSLNYQGQMENIVATFAHQISKEFKVILSLEDKTTVDQYPSDWIILKEPVQDIHSLMYYSKILISSGDSMAREGAMLGVPSIFCGIREMKANKIMIDRGMLFKKKSNDVLDFIQNIVNGKRKVYNQEEFREKLLNEWDDVTEFIIKQIKKYGEVYD